MKKLWILALCALLFGGCSLYEQDCIDFKQSFLRDVQHLSRIRCDPNNRYLLEAKRKFCSWPKQWESWRQNCPAQEQQEAEQERQRQEARRQEEARQRQEARQLQEKRRAEWESWQHKKVICKNKEDEDFFFFGDLDVVLDIEMRSGEEGWHMCGDEESENLCVDDELKEDVKKWLEHKQEQLLQSKQCKIVEFNPTRSEE